MVSVDYRVALPQIRQLLRDHSVSTRSAALTAVQSWHDLESVETIRWMAFADVNPFIRPQALDCLVAFLGAEAVPDLQKLEKDVNPQVRQQAALHLEKFPNQANETLAEDKVPKVFLWPENWYSPWTESDGPYREESGKLRVVDLARILWHWKTNLVCQPWPVSPDLLARLDQALSEVINLVEEAQEEIQATGSSGSGFVTDHP
jgi:hypothetical protein